MPESSTVEPQVLDHECDVIREYDNALPGWWTFLFWACILFSPLYIVYYHIGVGPSIYLELDDEMAAAAEAQLAQLGPMPVDVSTILGVAADPKKLLIGRSMFRTNCSVCHAADGGGNAGPNLCDDTYINIRSPLDFFRVMHDGVVPKGMPAWSPRYNNTQLVVLAGYVASLRGGTPAAPKAAQGDLKPAAWSTFLTPSTSTLEAPK